MAFEWLDAFELGTNTQIGARYFSQSISLSTITTGRTGAQSLQLRGDFLTFRRPVAKAEIVLGIALKMASWGATDFWRLDDSAGNRQATLRYTAAGTFELYRGNPLTTGVLLATSAAVTAGFWVYLELKYIVSNTVGAYEFRINEVSMFSASNVDTQDTALANIYDVTVRGLEVGGGTPSNNLIDDYYIANLSQPIPVSGFYGNRRVEALFPNAFGAATGLTPFGNASNWQNVDENPHNSDTDYNYSSTVNASDLYGMQNLSSPNATQMVAQLTHVSRKDDALVRVVAPLIRSGGVTYPGENDSLTTSYAYYPEMWNFNPNTSDYFSISQINAIEAGIQVVS